MTKQKCKLVVVPSTNEGGKISDAAKINLIRKFQRIEGNFDCCASAYIRVCQQVSCLWREECMAMGQV